MNNSEAHQILVNDLILAFGSRSDCRIWKQINGVFRDFHSQRIVRVGLNGAADLNGICANGRRLEIEAKTGNAKQSKEQICFQKMIEKFNGIYIVARDVESAIMYFESASNG